MSVRACCPTLDRPGQPHTLSCDTAAQAVEGTAVINADGVVRVVFPDLCSHVLTRDEATALANELADALAVRQ